MLRNDPVLLTYDIQKMKFGENLGSILDFPGIPNQSEL